MWTSGVDCSMQIVQIGLPIKGLFGCTFGVAEYDVCFGSHMQSVRGPPLLHTCIILNMQITCITIVSWASRGDAQYLYVTVRLCMSAYAEFYFHFLISSSLLVLIATAVCYQLHPGICLREPLPLTIIAR
jgi:hypothetical protein